VIGPDRGLLDAMVYIPGLDARKDRMSSYRHVPHPHILRRKAAPPVRVADQFSRSGPVARFNTAFALRITAAVGSMWCAYIFAGIALFGLPSAISHGVGGIVQWVAQTFLQLVLLSIIIVGQNVQAAASDERAENTYQDAEAVLHEALQIQDHLLTQDRELERLIASFGSLPGGTAR
jgi:hypothetical protein